MHGTDINAASRSKNYRGTGVKVTTQSLEGRFIAGFRAQFQARSNDFSRSPKSKGSESHPND
jgi:hypothetical protein